MGDWPIGVPFGVCLALAALYARGGRGRPAARRRAWAFYGGLATIVLALDTPIDGYADRLFAVHMLQHVLLLSVAPPLLVLGRPWPRLWQPLPLALRRGAARCLAAAAPLLRPELALALFAGTIAAWHVPAAYDATLHNDLVHQAEHLTFVLAGIVFWAVVLGAPPLRSRLDGGRRCAYLVLGMVPGWTLAIVLAFARVPLYAYSAGHGRFAEQQLAAGVMWVPGSIPYVVAAVWSLYLWLDPVGPRRQRVPVGQQ